jgi:hypothetical protein
MYRSFALCLSFTYAHTVACGADNGLPLTPRYLDMLATLLETRKPGHLYAGHDSGFTYQMCCVPGCSKRSSHVSLAALVYVFSSGVHEVQERPGGWAGPYLPTRPFTLRGSEVIALLRGLHWVMWRRLVMR